jgi:uncharacterized protein (TIGR03084 family)
MSIEMTALLADLANESAALDAMIAPLTATQYLLPTPAEGWTIADQASHLAYFDEAALLAATDADRFRAEAAQAMASGAGFPDQVAARYRDSPGTQLRDWLLTTRRDLLAGFARIPQSARLPWYGPDMSAASSVTARLMETWAHGQDIADALAVTRPATARLRHIAHIGVRTIGFSFALRGLPPPDSPVRVEVTGPDGELWAWGPAGAADLVRAPALDFCLVVTQRRHHADTALIAEGPVAEQWISIAQAFAGPPGPGRPPSRARAARGERGASAA